FTRNRQRADVTLNIKEGPRYGFGTIRFQGDVLFSEAELIKGLGEPIDEPYTAQRVNTMQRNLEYFYKSRGHFQAEVEATSDPAAASVRTATGAEGRVYQRLVPITFTVQPGALFRFNGITVTGLDRLKPEFMANRFRDLKG